MCGNLKGLFFIKMSKRNDQVVAQAPKAGEGTGSAGVLFLVLYISKGKAKALEISESLR